MLVVTKIETIETSKNITEIERFIYDQAGPFGTCDWVPLEGQPVDLKVLKEVIRGRRFVHPKKGIDVVIGMTSQVAEVLGLQYESFEELEKSRSYWSEQHNDELCKNAVLSEQLHQMETWGLWKRIKCVFTGIRRPKL